MTDTEVLRKQVKEYIDHADAKSLRMVQAILEIEQEEGQYDDLHDIPMEHKQILDRRINAHEAGEAKTIAWDEVKNCYQANNHGCTKSFF